MLPKSELLMPAGSLEKLKIAILYGADAVYLGTPDLSLRTKSAFTLEEVVEGITFAHRYGKRVYLTLNLFSHNSDQEKLQTYVETVKQVKPDGVIIADPGIFHFVKTEAPELELHVSTQANVCSSLSVKFWQDQGAKLVVLGREVSFAELTEIRKDCPDIKLETFVHGAMCMTYSGRCMLSNYLVERGANQGNCANSCRWKYKVHMKLKDGTVKELNLTEENLELFEFFLEEECRPGELMQIEEDERGSYILNAKDLCLMPKLDAYLRLGIDSLKVEGRNKSLFYVAIVARAYRMAIDDWNSDPDNWSAKPYMEELHTAANRGYSLAFHEGRLTHHTHNYEDTHSIADWEFAGIIREVTNDAFLVEVKNRIEAGDVLEFVSPNVRKTLFLRIYKFELANNQKVTEVVHAGQKPIIRIPFELFDQEDRLQLKEQFPVYSVIRKEKALTEDEWSRLALDKTSLRIELGSDALESRYFKQRDDLQGALDEEQKNRTLKLPRMGTEGCCGRGCNGCLIFWHDAKYAKARSLLKEKKLGEMLPKLQRA